MQHRQLSHLWEEEGHAAQTALSPMGEGACSTDNLPVYGRDEGHAAQTASRTMGG